MVTITHHLSINDKVISIQDEIFLRRIIFSRYYYALYHKYLEHNPKLSTSTGTNTHSVILNNILSHGDPKLKQIFLKLRTLRTWSDYQSSENTVAVSLNLQGLAQDVYNIVKRTNINC